MIKIALPLAIAALAGCTTGSPANSKEDTGNLELNIRSTGEFAVETAKIYVDDIFVGNATRNRPILFLKNGPHAIRVECDGSGTYRQTITILGEPNHQVLNITLPCK